MNRVDPSLRTNHTPMVIHAGDDSCLLRTTKIALSILASLAGFVFLPMEIALVFTAVVIIGTFSCCGCLDAGSTASTTSRRNTPNNATNYENFMTIRPRLPGFQSDQKGDSSFRPSEQKGESAPLRTVRTPLPFNATVPPTRGFTPPRPMPSFDTRARGFSNPFDGRPALGAREREEVEEIAAAAVRAARVAGQVFPMPQPRPHLTAVPRPANVNSSWNPAPAPRGFARPGERDMARD